MEQKAKNLLKDSDQCHNRQKHVLQDRLPDINNFSLHGDLKDTCQDKL